jgi:hypothetical protein
MLLWSIPFPDPCGIHKLTLSSPDCTVTISFCPIQGHLAHYISKLLLLCVQLILVSNFTFPRLSFKKSYVRERIFVFNKPIKIPLFREENRLDISIF